MRSRINVTVVICVGLLIMILVGFLMSCSDTSVAQTPTPTIDRIITGKLLSIDVHTNQSLLTFEDRTTMYVTNASLMGHLLRHPYDYVYTYYLHEIDNFPHTYIAYELIDCEDRLPRQISP
jgi:hypothetical protein